jgi:hypothetical protein
MTKIILIIVLLIILIINNFKNNETFRSLEEKSLFENLTEEEKELFKKLAVRDFNSEEIGYFKSPYMCLDYADIMIYD